MIPVVENIRSKIWRKENKKKRKIEKSKTRKIMKEFEDDRENIQPF